MSGDPSDLHYADGTHRSAPNLPAPEYEITNHAQKLRDHLEWHNRTAAAPEGGVEVKLRDAVITVRPRDPEVDLVDHYEIEVHGVSVIVWMELDGVPRVRVNDERMAPRETEMLVGVNDLELSPYGEVDEGLVPTEMEVVELSDDVAELEVALSPAR